MNRLGTTCKGVLQLKATYTDMKKQVSASGVCGITAAVMSCFARRSILQ